MKNLNIPFLIIITFFTINSCKVIKGSEGEKLFADSKINKWLIHREHTSEYYEGIILGEGIFSVNIKTIKIKKFNHTLILEFNIKDNNGEVPFVSILIGEYINDEIHYVRKIEGTDIDGYSKIKIKVSKNEVLGFETVGFRILFYQLDKLF